MAYIYEKVESLEGKDLAGTGQCVALVQSYTKAPLTSTWKEGAKVKGNTTIKKGTAIATFVNGKYPNKAHGNHGALYISQDATGIKVMDQWSTKGKIASRTLPFKGQNKDGTYIDPSNNGDAFSVIE